MYDLWEDIKTAWRGAAGKPAMSMLIVLTLALAIGANSAMFSMVWHVVLAPLPYADGDRLVKLEQHELNRGRRDLFWSVPTLEDLRGEEGVYSDVLEYFQTEYTLHGLERPRLVRSGVVNWTFFDALGLEPAIGRNFRPEEGAPGAQAVMLLSREFWREAFSASPAVVGSVLEMNDRSYTVIGVLPEMPGYPRRNDIWIPNASDLVMSDERVVDNRRVTGGAGGIINLAIGKLNEGVSLEQARRETEAFTQRLTAAWPDSYSAAQGYAIELRPLKQVLVGDSKATFTLLLTLTLLVMLIACANIANLNLARLAARKRELAIREAVGASPARIRRQLLTESLLLSLVGGVLGVLLAYACTDLLADFAAGYSSLASEIELNLAILWFALLLTGLTGIITGAAAASGHRDISHFLKEGGDKATLSSAGVRRRQGLLLMQFALAFLLLTSSILVVISLNTLNQQDPGYDTERIVVASTILDLIPGAEEDPWEARDFMLAMLEDIALLPGVEGAATSTHLLLESTGVARNPPVLLRGGTQESDPFPGSAPFRIVSADYFKVMGIPLLSGRFFQAEDDENAPPVFLANEDFAEAYFPDGDALGGQVSFNGGRTWGTIIGVVGNTRSQALDSSEGVMLYTNFRANPTLVLNLYARTTGNPIELGDMIRGLFQRLAPQQPIGSVEVLDELRRDWLAPYSIRTLLISLFGVLALAVTLSGVFGVVSFDISQRLREIGIRLAIGANPLRVRIFYLARGLKLCLWGLLIGLVLVLLVKPLIEPLLYQMEALEPGVYLASALLLILAVLAAMYRPVKRASEMSPAETLHTE